MSTFKVHYGLWVRVVTLGSCTLLPALAAYGFGGDASGTGLLDPGTIIPVAILVVTGVFTVLGYDVAGGFVYVIRPIGRKCIARRVERVRADNHALDHASRTLGNMGLLAVNDWLRSRFVASLEVVDGT
ncbi:MAG: hypothetical protein WB784_03565 [Rhodanobacteraceae bacterium]